LSCCGICGQTGKVRDAEGEMESSRGEKAGEASSEVPK